MELAVWRVWSQARPGQARMELYSLHLFSVYGKVGCSNFRPLCLFLWEAGFDDSTPHTLLIGKSFVVEICISSAAKLASRTENVQ